MAKKISADEVLLRAADGTAPTVSVDIVNAVKQFANGLERDMIERLLRQGAFDKVQWQIDFRLLERLISKGIAEGKLVAFKKGLDAASSTIVATARTTLGVEPTLTFDATNPRVSAYIRSSTARRVTQVTEESRDAIKAIVHRAMLEELDPGVVFDTIKRSVGLNARQERAVENYRQALAEKGTPRAAQLVDRYAEEQLKFRARVIARTEVLDAVNHGHLEGQRQAQKEGLFSEGKKRWVVTPDDRLCPTCSRMDGKEVPLHAPFKVTIYSQGKNGSLKARGSTLVDCPPAHPQCRCTHELVITEK